MAADPLLSSLIRINTHRMRSLRRELAPYRYTGTMHLIMFYLNHNPGGSQDDVAAWYAVDKTSVAKDAKKLEELGHITRTINPENRRRYRMYLTEEGRAFLTTLRESHNDFAERIFAALDEDEYRELAKLLKKVETALSGESPSR